MGIFLVLDKANCAIPAATSRSSRLQVTVYSAPKLRSLAAVKILF